MDYILIADAGSSKTDWSLIPERGCTPFRFQSNGINPAICSDEDIINTLTQVKRNIEGKIIKYIYFYGAGCATDRLKTKISKDLNNVFGISNVFVESDLIGASIALFGDTEGITCILGTGSNTGLYSKGKIIKHIPPLGYILGDEGSGVALGKRLLNSVFKRQLPEIIIKKFEQEFNLSVSEILNEVYCKTNPSQFIASFSPFLLNNIDTFEVKKLVRTEFENFFTKNILPYGDLSSYKIGIVGSIGYNYQEIIKEIAKQNDLEISLIIQKPITYLEKYYSER